MQIYGRMIVGVVRSHTHALEGDPENEGRVYTSMSQRGGGEGSILGREGGELLLFQGHCNLSLQLGMGHVLTTCQVMLDMQPTECQCTVCTYTTCTSIHVPHCSTCTTLHTPTLLVTPLQSMPQVTFQCMYNARKADACTDGYMYMWRTLKLPCT